MNMHVTPKSQKECIIRPYIASDIPFIVESVAQEVPQLPNYKGIKVSKPRLEYVLVNNLTGTDFGCWVLVDKNTHQLVGGSAGYCAPSLITTDKIAQDTFLFVYPEWRTLRHCLMLITAYNKWAIARGAKMVMATHTGGHRPEAFGKLMERMGYIEAGRQWMLRLDDGVLNRA